jgi:heptosyltransferase II
MPESVIVRLPNWLGDTVMAVPLLHALRSAKPEARIAVAGPWATLLAGQGLADVLVTYPRSWSGRLRTADSVRALRADVALLLPNSLEAALAACYWRARRRLGFAAAARSRLLTDPVPLPRPRRHQVDEYLLLLEPLGVAPLTREPHLRTPAEGSELRGQARALLREVDPEARGPRVGVHIGAAYGSSKIWPVERLVEFCRHLQAGGAVPVLLGTAADLVQAAAIREAVAVASLVGRDSPALMPAVLAELAGLVCGDTGVAHLAAALGTPVVALFGPTDPALTAPRGPADVVSRPTPCAPCFYRVCPIDHPCLRAITADEVGVRLRRRLRAWA